MMSCYFCHKQFNTVWELGDHKCNCSLEKKYPLDKSVKRRRNKPCNSKKSKTAVKTIPRGKDNSSAQFEWFLLALWGIDNS